MLVMKIKSNEIKVVEVSSIIPNPKNMNKHSPEQIQKLCDLIKHNGFREPLIISNRSGFLICGHGRLEAAKILGMKKIPVIFQDFENEAEEYQFAVSHNAIASWSELDRDLIFEELKNFPEIEIENLALNFDFSKLDAVLDSEDDDNDGPEEKSKKYLLEVQLHNELDLRDLYDDLISKGFMVREKKS